MFRINRLCDLAAQKSTSLAGLRQFINAEPININERHTQYRSRPVDFAAQQGSFDSFIFFVEEMQASMKTDPEIDSFNTLQWAHYPCATPEINAYLTDPEKKRWLLFDDGLDGLHIAAYLGQRDVVENLLTANPERICEMIRDCYTPLYWANLGKQVEMQALLKSKLAAYREQYAAQDEKMFMYHYGMIMAALGSHEDYAEFADFIALGKKMSVELNWQLDDYLCKIYKLTNIAYNQKQEEKKLAQADTRQLALPSIRLMEQSVKVVEEFSAKITNRENLLINDKFTMLELCYQAAVISWDLLINEREKQERNWDAIQEYLNNVYNCAEQGLNWCNQLSDFELKPESDSKKNSLWKKLSHMLTNAEQYEPEFQKENGAIKIIRTPIDLFFNLLKHSDTTPEMVAEFLVSNPISPTQLYRSQTFIEYAVCHSSTSVARSLIEAYRAALATSKHEKRLSLLYCLRDNTDIPKSTCEYILDPSTEIWKAFEDNTTELHIDAFAGRIESILKTLSESPERIYEVNTFGEGIFFWAFYSDDRERVLSGLDEYSMLYLNKAAKNKEWENILKFLQSLVYYHAECLTAEADQASCEYYADWFAALEITDQDKTSEYVTLNDYLYSALSGKCLKVSRDAEEREEYLNLADESAQKIINPEKRSEYTNKVLEKKIRLLLRDAETNIALSEDANFVTGDYAQALGLSETAISILGQALMLLSAWQTTLENKKALQDLLDKSMADAKQQLLTTQGILGIVPSVEETSSKNSYSLTSFSFLNSSSSSSSSSSSRPAGESSNKRHRSSSSDDDEDEVDEAEFNSFRMS